MFHQEIKLLCQSTVTAIAIIDYIRHDTQQNMEIRPQKSLVPVTSQMQQLVSHWGNIGLPARKNRKRSRDQVDDANPETQNTSRQREENRLQQHENQDKREPFAFAFS